MTIHERFADKNITGVRVGRFNFGINSSFIVYRYGDVIIDAGPSNQWSSVKQFLLEQPARAMVLTHHHEDHSGNAARAAKQLALPIFAPELSYQRLEQGFHIPLYQRLAWGKPLPVITDALPSEIMLASGACLKPIHTPGHAFDLHCLYCPEEGFIFTGDLYISKSLRYLRYDENLFAMINSMKLVLNLNFDQIFCPHRGIINDGRRALQAKLNNIVNLCQKAQAMANEGLNIHHIRRQLLGKEDLFTYISNFHFSKLNLIKEALKVPLDALSSGNIMDTKI